MKEQPRYQPDQIPTPRKPGEGSHGVSKSQGEQQPQGGNINKPELHPPTERPLPFEPNPLGHDEHTDDLEKLF